MCTNGTLPLALLVPNASPYQSLVSQAHLLAAELASIYDGKLDVSWLTTGTLRRSTAAIKMIKKGSGVIYHYGSFDWVAFPLAVRSKTIFVYHNVTPAHFFWKWQPKVGFRSLLSQLQLRMLPKTITWVAVSEFNANCLRGFGFQNVAICPLVIREPCHDQAAVPNKDVLLYVGRIAPNKNCHELLRQSVKASEALGRKLTLRIVGDTKPGCPYGKEFVNLTRRYATHPLLHMHWISAGTTAERLYELYAGSALYVSMSLHEGFGLPVCESIACARPALYLQCGGTESVLAGQGMVTLDERERFWGHIVAYLESASNRERLLRAQMSQLQGCTRPWITEKIRKVYSSLLAD